MIEEKELIGKIDEIISRNESQQKCIGIILGLQKADNLLEDIARNIKRIEYLQEAKIELVGLKDFILQKSQAKKKTCAERGCNSNREDFSP